MFSKMNELLHYTAQTKRGPAGTLSNNVSHKAFEANTAKIETGN